MTASIATQSNYGLILFPNILNNARSLSPEDSDPTILLTALSELRFHGGDPKEIRKDLAGYNLIAFNLLAEPLIRSMTSYKQKCAQSANAAASDDSGVVGGGMILQDNALRVLAEIGRDTETGAYFNALYQVHSGEADIDDVEASLPRGAKMVFMMTRDVLFGKKPKKPSRSEINRQNANRRWAKKRAAEKGAEVPSLPSEVADISLVLDNAEDVPAEQITDLPGTVSELVLPAESPEKCEPSEPAKAKSEEIPTPVLDVADPVRSTDTVCIKVHEKSCENANACKCDAKSDLHLSTNKEKKYKNKKNLTPPYPPHKSQRSENRNLSEGECENLRAKFEKLYDAYPKHEERGRAWGAFYNLNSDEEMFEAIFRGLNEAKRNDKRFRSEYRYIPLLCNWLAGEGWKSENMHRTTDPTGRHINYNSKLVFDYAQRPRPTLEEADRRNMEAMLELEAKYGCR